MRNRIKVPIRGTIRVLYSLGLGGLGFVVDVVDVVVVVVDVAVLVLSGLGRHN